jgi:4-nitrophenyl phosphatase
VTGDQGGRDIITRYAAEAETIEVDDPAILADIDTPEDYRQLLTRRHKPTKKEIHRQAQDAGPILRPIRHLVVDMDGVLWRGQQPTADLQAFFAFLRERRIGFVLATNNASQPAQQYAEKLVRFGVDIPLNAILSSAQAAASYLAHHEPPGTPVHLLGAEGLHQAMREQGLVPTDGDARYVVVGWTRDLTWDRLAQAVLLIRGGATFIGTNPDVTFPSEVGLLPGNGATLAALYAATGVKPLVIGKPEPWLYQEAMRRLDATPETTAVIGDRLDTDITGGKRLGMHTILVLSGITTQASLADSPIQPDLVFSDIGALVEAWSNE